MNILNLLLYILLTTFNLSAQQKDNKNSLVVELKKANLTSKKKPLNVGFNISAEDYTALNSKADSILNTISAVKKQNLFKEVLNYKDKALTAATNRYPNPDDIYQLSETQIILEEKNIKLWAAKYAWYNQLNLTADKKFIVATSSNLK
tara:strand:+ start:3515 stop:3958 length:444 start_codon:yes stop_codon:yes gene_type:complete